MTEKRYTLNELTTLAQAAELLGLKFRTAQERARVRNLGKLFGGTIVLTPEDVDALAEVTSYAGLTETQARVVALAESGLSYSQIAKELGVTPGTVAQHRARARQKEARN
jgi:DNA-binding CsgD family transcriptional regulator